MYFHTEWIACVLVFCYCHTKSILDMRSKWIKRKHKRHGSRWKTFQLVHKLAIERVRLRVRDERKKAPSVFCFGFCLWTTCADEQVSNRCELMWAHMNAKRGIRIISTETKKRTTKIITPSLYREKKNYSVWVAKVNTKKHTYINE